MLSAVTTNRQEIIFNQVCQDTYKCKLQCCLYICNRIYNATIGRVSYITLSVTYDLDPGQNSTCGLDTAVTYFCNGEITSFIIEMLQNLSCLRRNQHRYAIIVCFILKRILNQIMQRQDWYCFLMPCSHIGDSGQDCRRILFL